MFALSTKISIYSASAGTAVCISFYSQLIMVLFHDVIAVDASLTSGMQDMVSVQSAWGNSSKEVVDDNLVQRAAKGLA